MKWLKLVKKKKAEPEEESITVEGLPPMAETVGPSMIIPTGKIDPSIIDWGASDTTVIGYPKLPEPKDIPIKLALDALTAQGVLIKNIQATSSYSYDMLPEIELVMTVQPDPMNGEDVIMELHSWVKAQKPWGMS